MAKRTKSSKVEAPVANPTAAVAQAILDRYGSQVAPTALCLRTPVPTTIPLSKVKTSAVVREFVRAYLPPSAALGLYSHQASVIKAIDNGGLPNIAMTTATGSGKSLAFLAWMIHSLNEDKNAKAIACFPTQALLWGQVERLRRMSTDLCLHGPEKSEEKNPAYAGTLSFGKTRIPWSVWHGTQQQLHMKRHEEDCDSFRQARLRLATLDKVHWSLFHGKNDFFFDGLRAFVVDEAHVWHGLVGANVRGLFNRLKLSCDVLKQEHPAFFLASATLQNAQAFAADLTGCSAESFLSIDDRGLTKAETIDASKVPDELNHAGEEGLRRYVLFLKPEPNPVRAAEILGERSLIGTTANALCFVQSKFVGHRLRLNLHGKAGRNVIAYDGDMTAEDRRQVERHFFSGTLQGQTVVATSALEVGVDLSDLDVAVLDELPPRRSDLLQRLGRVGRSKDRPGLAVLCLDYSLADDELVNDPLAAMSLEGAKPLPLPLHLESVNLRMIRAAFEEWRWRLKKGEASWPIFNKALDRYFGQKPTFPELMEIIEEKLGGIVDLGDTQWFYKGFRASASQGKRYLVLQGEKNVKVAMIDDIAVFRDAHPEAVYLGHRGDRYRIVRYRGNFRVGEWSDPNATVVLGKFMKILTDIEVVSEPRAVATRGRWKDRFVLDDAQDLPSGSNAPRQGTLDCGVWSFFRKFDGYSEIDLTNKKRTKIVSLAEVSQRFQAARTANEEFPFLHDFSYRTHGWQWNISRILVDPQQRKELSPVLEGLLSSFFCSAVQCASGDLTVTVTPDSGHLRVIDATPGGNGLSEALLRDSRVSSGFMNLGKALKAYSKQPERFKSLLAAECQVDATVSIEDVSNAIDQLARAWGR
jgi:DEAD/DEAH box helicase/Helicase conserved C-terminal domain